MSKSNTTTNSSNEQIQGLQTRNIPLKELHPNNGQLQEMGLPTNPRLIRDTKFKLLVQSIQDDPEMLALRELLVFDSGNEKTGLVIVGGNMRYRAMKKLGYEDAPCKVLPPDFPIDKLRRIVLKDNSSYGEIDFDLLLAGFDDDEILKAAIEVPDINTNTEEEEAKDDGFDIEAATPKKAKSKIGDIYRLGNHLLICGDSTDPRYMEALMDGQQADLLVTDPPYNVNYQSKGKMKIENDNMDDANFLAFLTDVFTIANDNLKQGGAFYIWHADGKPGLAFRQAAKNVGWEIKQLLVWNKNSFTLGRQDYQWKHEPCQPAGTMVETTTGVKPIEELRDGDRVISYDSLSGQVKGRRNGGYEIRTANRRYDGLLYSITAAGKTTRATDNHEFSVRFNPETKANYCTYLMRRGKWWRVGQTKAYDARQFGLKTRLNQEHADEIWLLSIHEDKVTAQVMEQILTCKYGIPYTIWEQDRFGGEPKRTQQQIASIYEALDLAEMKRNAHRLLHDFNRSERFPFITKDSKREKFSTRVTARIHACNLVPELMQLPIPTGGSEFEWRSIEAATAEHFTGTVYSLAVQQYQHYIADGIITHNCLYGWKEGAAHYFRDIRSLSTVLQKPQEIAKMTKAEMQDLLEKIFLKQELPTTVIDCEKPLRNEDHPTMKPVPLIGHLVNNSSRRGDIVLNIFGGSGTTLVVCEQMGRKCRMVEFEPIYVDVIIKRWEELTGMKAFLQRNILETDNQNEEKEVEP